jgi:putative membrane protein
MLLHFVANWLVSAFALWLVARIVPGVEVRSFGAAVVATAVIAVVNAIAGPVLRFITFPLTLLTLGLFLLVVNAILLKLAAALAPGFRIVGFLPAILGSLVLTILTSLLRYILFS